MADFKIFTANAKTTDDNITARGFGFEQLNAAVPDAEHISSYEYLATKTDGGKVWRAYAHKGPDMWIAEVVDYS